MRTWRNRCKHCGKEYSYQASGEGCFDKLNNREYCPECWAAILAALEKIPVHYSKRLKEVERPSDDILEKFQAAVDKEKKYDEDYKKQYGYPAPRAKQYLYFEDWVKTAAEFTSDFVLYRVESPSDDLFDKDAKWFRQEEYDLISKQFTGNIWLTDSDNNRYYQFSVGHFCKAEDLMTIERLPEPSGKLWFFDTLSPKK